MATFKPLGVGIPLDSVFLNQGGKVVRVIDTSNLNLILLHGIATGFSYNISGAVRVVASNVVLRNGALLGWYAATAGTPSAADFEGYTDETGRYGVTVATGNPIVMKFYANGEI